jgi:predicted DNA-binding transcriptional regulator AlpA
LLTPCYDTEINSARKFGNKVVVPNIALLRRVNTCRISAEPLTPEAPMARPALDNTPIYGPNGPPLNPVQSAARAGVSVPHWWKLVAAGEYPPPFYPSPRNPRWYGSEIDEANEKRRMLPRYAKLMRARRAAARQRAQEEHPAEN